VRELDASRTVDINDAHIGSTRCRVGIATISRKKIEKSEWGKKCTDSPFDCSALVAQRPSAFSDCSFGDIDAIATELRLLKKRINREECTVGIHQRETTARIDRVNFRRGVEGRRIDCIESGSCDHSSASALPVA
jgi:hypothetical protein